MTPFSSSTVSSRTWTVSPTLGYAGGSTPYSFHSSILTTPSDL